MAHDHTAFTVVGIMKATGSVIDQLILTNTASIWNVHSHESAPVSEDSSHDHSKEENHDGAHDHDHDHDHHNHDKGHAGHGHVHDNSVEDLLSHPEEDITSILVQFKSKKNFQALSMPRNINENTELMAASPAYQINNLNANIGVGTNALRYLAMLIAFVSGLSIFISLFKSLQERKYELALMRVSGASRAQLAYLILLEGLVLAIVGFILGILVSHIASALLGIAMSDAYQYDFSAWKLGANELRLFIASLIIGIVAALIPAIKAFNTDISKTLSSK